MPGLSSKANVAFNATPCNTLVPAGRWFTLLSSLTPTAATSTERRNPFSASGSHIRPTKVGSGIRRMIVRGFYDTNISAVVTNPVVQLFGGITVGGADPVISESTTATTFPSDGTFAPKRLDNNLWTASGITVTFNPSTDGNDGTYKYTAPIQVSSSEFIDLCNSEWVIALTETAAAGLTGGTLIGLQACFVD